MEKEISGAKRTGKNIGTLTTGEKLKLIKQINYVQEKIEEIKSKWIIDVLKEYQNKIKTEYDFIKLCEETNESESVELDELGD